MNVIGASLCQRLENIGARKHMMRVLAKGVEAQCPGEEVAARRKYDFEIKIDKVEKYWCKECRMTIVGYDKIMKHTGTHIEIMCGKKSRFGRDEELWHRAVGDGRGVHDKEENPKDDSTTGANSAVNHDNVFRHLDNKSNLTYIEENGEFLPTEQDGRKKVVISLVSNLVVVVVKKMTVGKD